MNHSSRYDFTNYVFTEDRLVNSLSLFLPITLIPLRNENALATTERILAKNHKYTLILLKGNTDNVLCDR